MTARPQPLGIAGAGRCVARAAAGLAVVLLCACAPTGLGDLSGQVSRAAREQLLSSVAAQYRQRLAGSIDTVVAELGRPGGYLDDPLVRILLPPPLALALGTVRDLRADPQAALLETLMNRAAEQAIPGAAPLVRAALQQITPGEARRLLEGDGAAASAHLQARAAATLQTALQPIIAAELAANGASIAYEGLADAYRAQQAATPTDASVPPPAAAPPLADYVTERAVDGLFATLGRQEAQIRRDLDRATGGMLQPAAPAATAQ